MAFRLRHLALTVLIGTCATAQASDINFISSVHSGHLLGNSGGVGAAVPWGPQHALQGFSGSGQIQSRGQCLTGKQSGQPLRWEGCRSGDKSQAWALRGAKLSNEIGFCADLEGENRAANARLVAWSCTGRSNQQWRAHGPAQIGRGQRAGAGTAGQQRQQQQQQVAEVDGEGHAGTGRG